jgi:hypothetical protein
MVEKEPLEENRNPGKLWTAAEMRKGPECVNDIRDRDLKQQQRGSERIKDLGD